MELIVKQQSVEFDYVECVSQSNVVPYTTGVYRSTFKIYRSNQFNTDKFVNNYAN